MAYLKIGNTDVSNYVSALKVATETIVSDDSGRNANGDMVVDIVSTKKKLQVEFRPMNDTEMQSLLTLIASFVVSVTYLEPTTKALATITCYTNTPEPDYYTIQSGKVQFNTFSLNFIQM